MSTVVAIRYVFGVTSGGELVEFAQPFVTPQLTLDAPPVKYQVPLAVSAGATAWAAATSFPASFKVLAITASGDVQVTFTVQAGEAQERSWTEKVISGGFPLVKFSDVSRDAADALSVIDKIEILNLSDTDAVVVTVFIGT